MLDWLRKKKIELTNKRFSKEEMAQMKKDLSNMNKSLLSYPKAVDFFKWASKRQKR